MRLFGRLRRSGEGVTLLTALAAAAVFSRAQDRGPAEVTGLTVPAGFEVERVAGPPLVNRPIVADFDENGRLYVADSSGSNDRVEQQLASRPHRVVRLEDTDGDGRFDASVVFADRMMLPEGAMWHDGSLYVAAPPSIWKLTDTDGDGVADRREEWFRGETLTGCANDLHGPYLGPDGWIYWTKGALGAMAASNAASAPASARVRALPESWARALARTLNAADATVTRQVLRVARAFPDVLRSGTELSAALAAVARDSSRPPALRLEALAAFSAGSAIDADLFDLVQTGLAPGQPAGVRSAAASAIERAALTSAQLAALVPRVQTAGPLDLPRLLTAFDRGSDLELGLALVDALGRSAARATVRAEVLRPRLEHYPEAVRRAGEALLASIRTGIADQAGQLDELDALVPLAQAGDLARGQAVFNSTKAACLSCHAIGYVGGRIGPDLTRIGRVRDDRDLLESILFPSISFARGYEPVTVLRRAGERVSGVLRGDGPDEIVLADAAGSETRIPRGDVVDVQPGALSLMPAGYGEVLTRQELADLVAFLRAAR